VNEYASFEAALARRRRKRRALNLTLTVCTCGLWGLVWMGGALQRRPFRKALARADVPSLLGAPPVAWTFVSPKGMTRRTALSSAGGSVGGAVGGIIGAVGSTVGSIATEAVVDALSKTPPEASLTLPPGDTFAYLAVTREELALIKVDIGLRRPEIRQVLARVARGAVASAELDRGRVASKLRIRFANGGLSEFEIAAMHRDTAELVVDTLGGRSS
jgi:hypothetical protein